MFEAIAGYLPIAGGTVATLAVARYLWAAQAIAGIVRMLAIIVVMIGLGSVAGVVDLGRLVELVSFTAEIFG